MKKSGFTLAELLVTLSIIGIIAAITAPMIDGIIPDKDKAKVLKAYKTISEINEDILSDPSLYMQDFITIGSSGGESCTVNPDPGGTDTPCTGLGCGQAASDTGYNSVSCSAKYPYIFVRKLGAINPTASSANPPEYTYITEDGIGWIVKRMGNSFNANNVKHSVIIDVDSSSASNCTYATCTGHPDRFEFEVDAEGRVSGVDNLTRAYLANPNKLNDKKRDYERAASL